jgi:hypothetical protein
MEGQQPQPPASGNSSDFVSLKIPNPVVQANSMSRCASYTSECFIRLPRRLFIRAPSLPTARDR